MITLLRFKNYKYLGSKILKKVFSQLKIYYLLLYNYIFCYLFFFFCNFDTSILLSDKFMITLFSSFCFDLDL